MSRPLPILSNMPWNVKQDIINQLEFMTRFSLRKCSREFRDIIDRSRVEYPIVCIVLLKNGIRLAFYCKSLSKQDNMNNMIEYIKMPKDICKVRYKKRGRRWQKVLRGENPILRAISDFATFLKSPRISIGSFVIGNQIKGKVAQKRRKEMMLTCLKNTLEELPHQLNVTQLNCHFPATQDDVLHFLPYLKPRILTHIMIINSNREMEKLVVTDQWKQAEKLKLTNESTVRIENLLHLRFFQLINYRLVPEELALLIQEFLTRPFENLHYCIVLPPNYDPEPIRTWLNGNKTLSTMHYDHSWHTKIPGTDQHLNILFRPFDLQVYRFPSAKLLNFSL